MSLVVFTARLRTYSGGDLLDVSRGGRHPLGAVFAPSVPLLASRLALRRAGLARPETWPRYEAAYRAEMAASRERHPGAWAEVLGRPVVTLGCHCENASECHRLVLAKILAERGAAYEGER